MDQLPVRIEEQVNAFVQGSVVNKCQQPAQPTASKHTRCVNRKQTKFNITAMSYVSV